MTGNRLGSRFHLCELSRGDIRFPKYPRLPVLACEGYRSLGEPEQKEEQQ